MPSYYHQRIREYQRRLELPGMSFSNREYYRGLVEYLITQEFPCAIRAQEMERDLNGLLPAIRIAGMPGNLIRARPIEHSRDSILAEMASVQPNPNSDDILEELFDNGCGMLMKKKASQFGRLMGMEFEVSGITFDNAAEIISISNRTWKVHSDCSIPQLGKPQCTCTNIDVIVCSRCGSERELCECSCRCHVSCQNLKCFDYGVAYRREYWNTHCRRCGTPIPSEDCSGECFDYYSRRRRGCNCGWESKSAKFCGAELVSPPGKTEEFLEMAQTIFQRAIDSAKANGCIHNTVELDRDRATGFHVHIDARDLSPEQIALCVPLMERQLQELAQEFPSVLPDWRNKGFYYCQLANPKDEMPLKKLHQDERDGCRYKAVNLDSLDKHGTIEFRIGFMPDTAEEAISWARRCRELVDSVAAIEPTELVGLNVKQGLELLSQQAAITEWIETLENDNAFSVAYFNSWQAGRLDSVAA